MGIRPESTGFGVKTGTENRGNALPPAAGAIAYHVGEKSSDTSGMRKNFRESPCADTLLLYFEALCDLGYDEELLKMQETEEAVIALMTPPSSDNAALWQRCLLAALKIEEIEYVEKHRETVLDYGQDFDKFSLLWELTKFYKARNLTEKYTVTREMVLSLMPRVKLEPYIKEATEQALQQL